MKKNKRIIVISWLITLITIVFVACSSSTEYYIYINSSGDDNNEGTKEQPVATVKKALQLASEHKKNSNSPVRIYLQESDYHLSEPILITPRLSNLSIIGDGVDKVSIKGSKILEAKWQRYDQNIWVTDLPKGIDFSQLFINGEKQILARYPDYDENGGCWQGYAEDAISKERVSMWKNPEGAFVHAMHKGRWGGFHFESTGIDDSGELILIGGHQNNRPSPMHSNLRMVENVFEELNSEQEWYFDKKAGKLFLWPKKDIDLQSALTEVSILNHLVEIKGTFENPVKNITIEGIKFEQTQRTFMEKYHPLLRSDWTIYRGGAVFFDGAESCFVNNCEFTNLGGNVVFINGYNRNIQITKNHIHNCGASAICFVGDSTAVRSPSFQYSEYVSMEEMDTVAGPANELYPSDCLVENNLIYRIGRVEKQVAGVQISMAMNIHVKNNSIYDVPRAGINVSEGTWGGHIIEYNDVFNTVLETSDHGAFNSWGRDRFWHPKWATIDSLVEANPQMPYWDAMHTTIIRNNRFKCNHGWDIDLDDGSSNYHIYYNLCLNGGIKLREGFYRIVENNIMVNNGFHPHVWFNNSEDIFRQNIMMTKHFPIRLQGWGKEVDYNLFPDSTSLALAKQNNTDANSIYGNPEFIAPEKGDFRVEDTSIAFALGFKNFPMDSFGVQHPKLKSIAKQPVIPQLNTSSFNKGKTTIQNWLGGKIKNIETPEEQSASGLHSMDGVILVEVSKNTKLAASGIINGDVILAVEEKKIKGIVDLMSRYKEKAWHEYIKVTVLRNQQEIEVIIKLQ